MKNLKGTGGSLPFTRNIPENKLPSQKMHRIEKHIRINTDIMYMYSSKTNVYRNKKEETTTLRIN